MLMAGAVRLMQVASNAHMRRLTSMRPVPLEEFLIIKALQDRTRYLQLYELVLDRIDHLHIREFIKSLFNSYQSHLVNFLE